MHDLRPSSWVNGIGVTAIPTKLGVHQRYKHDLFNTVRFDNYNTSDAIDKNRLQVEKCNIMYAGIKAMYLEAKKILKELEDEFDKL